MPRNPKVEARIDAERNTPPKPGARQMPGQFAIRNLSVLAYANGFTLWHYKASRTPLAEVAADGFFSDASDMVAAGDFIIASASDGGRVLVVSCSDLNTVTTKPYGGWEAGTAPAPSTTKPDALNAALLAAVMDCGHLLSGIIEHEDDGNVGAYHPWRDEHLRLLRMCERALDLARAEGRT